MYLHLGMDKVITFDDIIGIFDLDTTTVSKNTRNYLAKAEKAGIVVCRNKNGEDKVYIAQISSTTLQKRTGYVDSISNL